MGSAGTGGGDFRVLGPLEVDVAGRLLDLGGPRLRVLLALLLVGAGRVVSVPTLVDELWGQHGPPDADRTVRAYVSRLRRALAPLADPTGPATASPATAVEELIVTRSPGYQLRLPPDALDAARFERLVAAGRQAMDEGRPAAGADRLRVALALWRGDAYGEFGDSALLRTEAVRLTQLRLAAVADRIDADLAVGLGGELIAELEELIRRLPGHERLWGQLMIALYRAGRQVDALAAYSRARAVLLEESGIEPSPGLADIQRQILAQDEHLLGPRRPAPPVRTAGASAGASAGVGAGVGAGVMGSGATRPAQLPPAMAAFTGRHRELAALDATLAAATRAGGPPAMVISVVSGTAGVGKTALAVHWAHRVADQFPDGQLYLNLRGYDPGGPAVSAHAAVRGFLDALGVPVAHVPADHEAQTALYRSLLAGKRMLVVLDNAATVEQVRPLLPGAPGCLVLVTSRDRLSGLVALDGAQPLTLDVLSAADARQLLTGRLGARVAAEPAAVEEIVAGCARLPLALAIVAARAATSPRLPLAALAGQLGAAGCELDPFADTDPRSDLRAVFSWSYQALGAGAARLFRLLALHTGPELSIAAAASLAGLSIDQVRPLLAELTRGHLLTEPAPDRFSFHDLLRAYAAELACSEDPEPDRRAAVHRLLDHYLHTGHLAATLLAPHRDPITLRPAPAGTTVLKLADNAAALAWFGTEHRALLAAIDQATAAGFHRHVVQLAWTLPDFLDYRGHWHDLVGVQRAALAAATRLADPAEVARAHRSLGYALSRFGDIDAAHASLSRALAMHRDLDDDTGQAHAHRLIALTLEGHGRYAEALGHAEQSLRLYRSAGHPIGMARMLNMVGWIHSNLGDHRRALIHCHSALRLSQQIGHPATEAATWDSLGHAYHHLGEHAQAVTCYQHALDLYRQVGDRHREAVVLDYLGDTHRTAGDRAAAHDAWRRAATILDDLRHPDAATIRAKLPTAPVTLLAPRRRAHA